MCDKTCIFFFFPIINKYFLMAKRSLLSRCPSYHLILKVKFTPEQAIKTLRGSNGRAMFFFLPRRLMGRGWSTPHPGSFTPGKDPVPIVQEAGWAPWSIWMDAENLATTGFRSPDRPARSESLYRLSYPGPRTTCFYIKYPYFPFSLFLFLVITEKLFRCLTLYRPSADRFI